MEARFAIGTQFYTGGKFKKLATVTDIYKTYNAAGELVRIRYEAEHEFCGQIVKDHDIVDASIARNLVGELV